MTDVISIPKKVTCEAYNDCNVTLANHSSAHSTRSDYESYMTGIHFHYFVKDPSTVDWASFVTVNDAFECSYRYYVCKQGLNLDTSSKKIAVYIGDEGSSASYPYRYINLAESILDDDYALETSRYRVPAHELYHLVQYSTGNKNTFDSVSESSAEFATQFVSWDLFNQLNTDGFTSLTKPELQLGYDVDMFFRYLFEQLEGGSPQIKSSMSKNAAQIYRDQRNVLEPHFKAWTSHVGSQDSSTEVSKMLALYLETVTAPNALSKSLDQLEQNYRVAVYAYPYLDASVHPQYSFVNGDFFKTGDNALNFYGEHDLLKKAVLVKSESVQIRNDDEFYRPQDMAELGLGFYGYLAAEYHKLNLDSKTASLKIKRKVYDEDIVFMVIFRSSTGSVSVHRLFNEVSTKDEKSETFSVPYGSYLTETVFVAYTRNANPITNNKGRLFSVSITATK